MKPWLLEVNLSPSLGCESPLDTKLKSAMLADLLTLVGIPATDPMTRPKCSRPHKRDLSMTRHMRSSDSLPYAKKSKSKREGKNEAAMTSEECKLADMARRQFERRGGFVRVFPAPDTWRKYNKYLDAMTGIPTIGLSQFCGNISNAQNYNRFVHSQLYPGCDSIPKSPRRSRDRSLGGGMSDGGVRDKGKSLHAAGRMNRLLRYERSLSKGYTTTIDAENNNNNNNKNVEKKDICMKFEDPKRMLFDQLRSGKKLSASQMKSAFVEYLQKILQNMKTKEGVALETECDVVLHFLQTMSRTFSTPQFKMPSENLKGNDKAAVTAKHLSDFLLSYAAHDNKVVENCTENVDESVLELFLEKATEGNLEEMLNWDCGKPDEEVYRKTCRISKSSPYQLFKHSKAAFSTQKS